LSRQNPFVGLDAGSARVRDVFGQAKPGLRQRDPKRFVTGIFGSPRHRHALFGAPSVIPIVPHWKLPD
jgi:hypothetical protein